MPITRRQKIGLGIAGGVAALAGGLALARKFKGRRRRGTLAERFTPKRGSVARIKNRVMRLALKIKEKQLKRKLFKEEMRI